MTLRELVDAALSDPPFEDPRLVDGGEDRWVARLVRRLKPKFIVELGTGSGRTAAQIAAAMHEFSFFCTINWPNPPSGDDVGAELAPWAGSRRVVRVLGDTREQAWRFPDRAVDLLYIDSTHTKECASAEWALYEPKLADGAVVVVDDLDHNDMREFWSSLPGEKVEVKGGRIGILSRRGLR